MVEALGDLFESIPRAPGPRTGLLSIQVKIYKTMVYETPTLNYQELLAHNGPWIGGLWENAVLFQHVQLQSLHDVVVLVEWVESLCISWHDDS